MSENRRVVVTGIGAITPLGNNVADTWNGLKNGKNAANTLKVKSPLSWQAVTAAWISA